MRLLQTNRARSWVVSGPRWAWPVAVVPIPLFAGLVALGAQIRVPVPGTDVPMTMQLLVVVLTGLALSPPRAVAAMLLYLGCGAVGLPVFAGSAGLLGPTGGYLVGFVLAAGLVSVLRGRGQAGSGRLLTAGFVGILTVFAAGITWRIVLVRSFGFFGGDTTLAVATGVLPFAAKAVVELLLAVTMVTSFRRLRAAHRSPRRGNVRSS